MPSRYLLLQSRNSDDPMRQQEVTCFARSLACDETQIQVHNLIESAPTVDDLRPFDVVLLGGSGDYSVAEGGPWLPTALFAMRELYELNKPTFASCWGFQAMALALGGKVVTDMNRAELGTLPVQLTDEGKNDPVFGKLESTFLAHFGHQDIVDELPPGAALLASTSRVKNEAFCFPGKPIYCTQFHPELSKMDLLTRLEAYPSYVEKIAGMKLEEFEEKHCEDAESSNRILANFMAHLEFANASQ